jgi:hypothetical protein
MSPTKDSIGLRQDYVAFIKIISPAQLIEDPLSARVNGLNADMG